MIFALPENVKITLGSFSSSKFIYTSLKSSQSKTALCLVLLDKSTLNLLQRASNELDVPGNLLLAISKVSIILFLTIIFLFISLSS